MPAMDYDRIAELYDLYVQTALDLDFFLREARKAAGPVLELMAGTGRVSIPLLEAGVDLTAVDSSSGMLEVFRRKLRERALSSGLIEADVCELSLGRQFDLVFIAFHAFAEIVSPARQRQALARVHDHLSERGRFICTLHNPPVRLRSVTGQRRAVGAFPLPGGGGTLFLSVVEYYDPATRHVTGTQDYAVHDDRDAILSKMAIDIRFHVHQRDTFEELATSMGFTVVALYGDYSYAPFKSDESPYMIWVLCRKRRPWRCPE